MIDTICEVPLNDFEAVIEMVPRCSRTVESAQHHPPASRVLKTFARKLVPK